MQMTNYAKRALHVPVKQAAKSNLTAVTVNVNQI
jgi:hypothetical protein